MNALDWVLVAVAVGYAISGYWQGFVTGAFATVGLLIGGLLGIRLAPVLLGDAEPSVWVSLAALLVVLVCAILGQTALQVVGSRIRRRIKWQPARALDAVGGAALSAAAVLVVAWALGVAVSAASIPGVSDQARSSTVLARVNSLMPGQAEAVLQRFTDLVGSSFFPQYLEPFVPEHIVEVREPPGSIGRDPDVAAARASVVKIRGQNECARGVEGSGFLYSPDRVLTNAHVVAGVDEPGVIVDDEEIPADVVYYDPDTDLAVLEVEDLNRPHLEFDRTGRPGQAAAVLGFPNDGPYDVQGARIRAQQRLRSPDIYEHGTVVREVFSLRALVRAGNSGGPLVSREGDVLGVIFAASVAVDQQTGYALTADQVAAGAARGLAADGPVDTGGCA